MAITIALIGVFAAPNSRQLALIWIVIGLPLLWRTRILTMHLRFLLFVVLPLSTTLFLVWGLIMGAKPGDLPHSSPRSGVEFALLITLRVMLMGTIVQGGLFSLGPDRLIAFCADLGIPRDLRIMIVGATVLVPEMTLRASQVFTARCARGLLKTRRPADRIRQLPAMLRALVAWALRSAVDRSEMWTHRRLLANDSRNIYLGALRAQDYAFIAAPSFWLIYNIVITVSK